MFNKIKEFFDGVVFEMKKVSWPSMAELKGSTGVVLAVTALFAVFLFVVDLVFSKIVQFIF